MFENRSETATARLQALIAKSQGKHRAREEPLVVCSDANGAAVSEKGARRGRVSGTFFHAIFGNSG